MKISDATFTILDVETTGLYPYSGDKICEIGAVKGTVGSKRVRRFQSLINPERSVSPGAFSVNGITEAMLEDAPLIEEIIPDFLKFIDGSVLVAYNAGFDLGFLECALGHAKAILKDFHIIDALRLARRLFPGAARYSLNSLSGALGIPSSGGHRAMTDALMTWKIFNLELEILAAEGVNYIEEISRSRRAKTANGLMVKMIEEAIRGRQRLDITYRSVWDDRITKRTITPKAILRGYDRSYCVAHCHLKDAERNFRIDCILEARKKRLGREGRCLR